MEIEWTREQLDDHYALKDIERKQVPAGVHVLPSGGKIVVWYDQDGMMHINGMGAIISPEGLQ